MMKPDSLYNHGMRPLLYSEIDARKYGKAKGWVRCGTDVCYYQNSMKRKNAGYYYTLTFAVTFKYDNDTVYFAHSYPYTYTDLCRYLNMLEADPKRKNRMRRRPLCQTIAGNNCDLLIITTFSSDPEAIKNRKGVVLSSRVHPGETGASYMMKGIIDYLTGPNLNAKILRDNFIFKIVPMLNPDGVINGSS
jgi:murein tripeptide amidase MpaA